MTSKKFEEKSKVTKSYNSYGGSLSKTKRILKVLRESEHPLKPKEIALFAKINRSTCRVYLRRLHEKGEVSQPYPQFYVTKPIHGMVSESLPLVHNLVLGVRVVDREKLLGVRGFEGWFGAVKVRVVFGSRRGKVTGFVSCDGGMDLDKTVFAVDKFKSVVLDRVGVRIRDSGIRVVSCELNEDRKDLRLDGLNCVSVEDFRGFLERIYNKDGGLRSEVKVKPQSLEHIYATLKGGMTSSQILQSVGFLVEEMRELKEIMKFQNRLLVNVLGKNEGG